MINLNDRIALKDPDMANLHGEGWVFDIWDESKIQEHYTSIGSRQKVKRGEKWYRVVFDQEYQEIPDEYDEAGELLSCGSDNAITFGEEELIDLSSQQMSFDDIMTTL